MRARPLRERRAELERLLSGVSSPIVLCQQTADPAVAAEWLHTLTAGGLEGVVIKDGRRPYPARSGQRVWHKLKTRITVDLVAVGVVGDPAAPTSLVLALPSATAELSVVGSTTRLSQAAARAIAGLITLTGDATSRRVVWGNSEPVA